MALRIKRGLDIERQSYTPLQGEILYTTDTKSVYVGDGATQGGILVGPLPSSASDLINDLTPQLGGDLDLNNHNITGIGNINIDGTINATGNIGLGNDQTDVIEVGGVINSSLLPAVSEAYSLGSPVRYWKNAYVSGLEVDTTVDAGTVIVKESLRNGTTSNVVYDAVNDALSVSTIKAYSIGGDLVGSVFGDDSTVLVDGIGKTIYGEVGTFGQVNTAAIANTSIAITSELVDITNGSDGGNSRLRVCSTDPYLGTIDIDHFNNDPAGYGGNLSMGRGRGTDASRVILNDADNIFNILFLGHRAGGSDVASGILTYVDGTPSNGVCPGSLSLATTNSSGLFESRVTVSSSGMLTASFGIAGSTGAVNDTESVNLTDVATHITTTGASTSTMAAGTEGQIKTFVAVDVSLGDMVITVASAGWADPGTITFNTNATGCTLQFVNGAWYCIGNNGAVFN